MVLDQLLRDIDKMQPHHSYGQVTAVLGLLIEVAGLHGVLMIGSRCLIQSRAGNCVAAEVVGFREHHALLMPFSQTDGLGPGCRVELLHADPMLYPCERWLSRVINGFGEPLDSRGALPQGEKGYAFRRPALAAHSRRRIQTKMNLGIRSLNTFTTCCYGQRMGIFAGSGVGKSVLLSMIARFNSSDVIVIGLIGERGREVQEFIEAYLGEEGLARSVIVVATSDEASLMRRQAALTTMAVAEYFAEQGKEVLCFLDSVTRFAMAQREIGLSAGEPPASKGYTPSVFAELPKLLERAGPGSGHRGNITGLFTVLVEGDDLNEPIADAVRGILDGHIVLDRAIAERGRFPAVNVLRSVSRTMPDCNTAEETMLINRARQLIATYEDMADMVRLGAYRRGSDPAVDEAISLMPKLHEFLAQGKDEQSDFEQGFTMLRAILEGGTSGDGPEDNTINP